MRSENMVSITGYLGDQPNLKSQPKELPVVVFTVAQDERTKDAVTGEFKSKHTNWIPIVSFGSLASRVTRALKKGDLVEIKGSLRTSEYLKDGIKKKGFEVIAASIQQVKLLPANISENTNQTIEGATHEIEN